MNYLLDACVISEFTRRESDQKVIHWFEGIDEQTIFISAITIGEILRSIERLPESQRKIEFLGWINNRFIPRFGPRILPLETQPMFRWGSLAARLEASGQTVPLVDTLLAATALQHNLIIVTRYVSDFLPCGVQVFNPWA